MLSTEQVIPSFAAPWVAHLELAQGVGKAPEIASYLVVKAYDIPGREPKQMFPALRAHLGKAKVGHP